MPVAPKIYRRVGGRASTFVAVYRLYEGPDHLLLVRTMWFREDYRRFFYRDIQAVITRATNRRRDHAVVWGAFTGATLLPAVATVLASVPVLPYFLFTLSLVFATIFAVNWFLGPTCECHVQTAVQCETLPAMRRVGRVKKFLERLRPRIAEAQGVLPSEAYAAATVSAASAASADADLPPLLTPETAPPA